MKLDMKDFYPIMNEYKNNANSLHAKLKRSLVWSLMHDGISKFSTEYNGVYLQGIDEDLNRFDVPFCLTKLEGGVSAYDTADAIIQNVIDVHLEKNAYTEIQQYFNYASMNSATYIALTPPIYLYIVGG